MDHASDLFEAFEGSATADPVTLERLNAKCDEALALEDQVKNLTTTLEIASKALNRLKAVEIPEMMNEIGLEKIVRAGREIAVHDFISGSLPKEEQARAKAIKWLEEHDGAGIIKTTVSSAFGRGEHELATKVAQAVAEAGGEPLVETGVHSATLQSFARERLKNGEEIDTEVLGLYTGRVVKIKDDKPKGRRKAQ